MATTTTVRAIRRNHDDSVLLTSSGGNTQGDIVQLADGRIAVVEGLESVADGDPLSGAVTGQFDILKNATSDTYALGAPVFYDPTNKVAKTAAAAGYYYAGRCVKASASGDVYAYTDINATETNREPTAAVTATGSAQGDAAGLIEGFNVVTGADGTKGVVLPTAGRWDESRRQGRHQRCVEGLPGHGRYDQRPVGQRCPRV